MDLTQITPQDVATIASFIAPGYFAIQGYAMVHTKAGKDFSKLLIESIEPSLSLSSVGIKLKKIKNTKSIWQRMWDR